MSLYLTYPRNVVFHLRTRQIYVSRQSLAKCWGASQNFVLLYVCICRNSRLPRRRVQHNRDTENRWFERIPLIKSVLQDKPDPLLMNSTHSRCSTFRNSTRCNRWLDAKLACHMTRTCRHDTTLYLLQTLHLTLIKWWKRCLYAFPTTAMFLIIKCVCVRYLYGCVLKNIIAC